LARIINSDEIQSVVNPAKPGQKYYEPKTNPLRNTASLEKLDPHAAAKRRMQAQVDADRIAKKAAIMKEKRTQAKAHQKAGKEFYNKVSQQGSVCADGQFNIS
jgi:large subunit ribosomal protein L4e